MCQLTTCQAACMPLVHFNARFERTKDTVQLVKGRLGPDDESAQVSSRS